MCDIWTQNWSTFLGTLLGIIIFDGIRWLINALPGLRDRLADWRLERRNQKAIRQAVAHIRAQASARPVKNKRGRFGTAAVVRRKVRTSGRGQSKTKNAASGSCAPAVMQPPARLGRGRSQARKMQRAEF